MEMIRTMGTPTLGKGNGDAMDVDDEAPGNSTVFCTADPNLLRSVVEYGQELQSEFGNTEHEEVRDALVVRI